MMIVGLTGGIGSGKSTVAKLLQELGVPVYNSDAEAKKLMETSKVLQKKIKMLLGPDAYGNTTLNRSYIAEMVFNDKQLLSKLNAIVHPAVRKHFMGWATKQDHPFVVQETALLFENDAKNRYDKTILVTAPKEIRIQRIISRDSSTTKEILERMRNQLEDEQKIPLADFVVENITLSQTRKKVKDLYKALLEYC